ncbi:MAG: hypothetical protein GY813_09265 [Halieaceae bacterium]|nr:hypothetical protein [Halieaceae bacterium]
MSYTQLHQLHMLATNLAEHMSTMDCADEEDFKSLRLAVDDIRLYAGRGIANATRQTQGKYYVQSNNCPLAICSTWDEVLRSCAFFVSQGESERAKRKLQQGGRIHYFINDWRMYIVSTYDPRVERADGRPV